LSASLPTFSQVVDNKEDKLTELICCHKIRQFLEVLEVNIFDALNAFHKFHHLNSR